MVDNNPAEFIDTATTDTATPAPVPVVGIIDIPPVLPELPETKPVDVKLALDLQTLHAAINAIAPIDGLAIDNGEIIDIGYLEPVTAEQEVQIAAVLADWPLLRAKNDKLREIDADWLAAVVAGWTTPYGWKLGITTQDVTLLMGAFILAKEATAMGLPDVAAIIDTDGVTHSLALAELTALMLGYGQARAALSAADAAIRQAVSAATTLDELNAISV